MFGVKGWPHQNLINHVGLSESSGTTAKDRKSGDNFSMGNAEGDEWESAVIGNGFNSSVNNEFLNMGDLPGMQNGTQIISIALFFKLNANPEAFSKFFRKGPTGNYFNCGWFGSGDIGDIMDLNIGTGTSQNKWRITGTGVPTGLAINVFHHLCITFDGTQANDDRVKTYINGEDRTDPVPPPDTPTSLTTSTTRLTFPDDGDLNCVLDDIRIYDRILTPAEVQALSDRNV